jgi:hypothetical protein
MLSMVNGTIRFSQKDRLIDQVIFARLLTDKSPRLSRFSRHSPTILVTIGIFGSFWGISIGLINFDAQDIQKTTPLLLNGLKVKFISSTRSFF